MALVEAARAPASAGADGQPESWSWTDTFQQHPALWLLALFMLILPAFASNFVLIELFGWAMILGMIALSLMFLAGYGGMVSLVQMTVAGCAGYMVAIFGTSVMTDISLGWPWWVGVPLAIVIAVIFGTLSRRALGAHRGHLHHHDHARDRVGVLLLHAAELHDLQRLLAASTRCARRRPSASTGARRCRSTI